MDNEAPRTGREWLFALLPLAGYLRYSRLGEWLAKKRRR